MQSIFHQSLVIPPVGPCIWCWKRNYPDTPYPDHWSSSLCKPDKEAMLLQRRKLRKEEK